MTAKQVYKETLPFVWLKLLINFTALVLLGIIIFISIKYSRTITVFAGLVLVVSLIVIATYYLNYLIKVGHVAVVTKITVSGKIPKDQFKYGRKIVTKKFSTANSYFVVDKMIYLAVKQIQNGLNLLPNLGIAQNIINFFIGSILNYVDECCLGYALCTKEQNIFKSVTDGIVIYVQNSGNLIKKSLQTILMMLCLIIGLTAFVFTFLFLIFSIFDWNVLICAVLTFGVVLTIKLSFVDSYIMVSAVNEYVSLISSTEFDYDLYSDLSRISSKFKDLLRKGYRPQLV